MQCRLIRKKLGRVQFYRSYQSEETKKIHSVKITQSLSQGKVKCYEFSNDGSIIPVAENKKDYSSFATFKGSLTDEIVRYFFPKNYPKSVSPNYLSFARGQFISATVGTAGNIIVHVMFLS